MEKIHDEQNIKIQMKTRSELQTFSFWLKLHYDSEEHGYFHSRLIQVSCLFLPERFYVIISKYV